MLPTPGIPELLWLQTEAAKLQGKSTDGSKPGDAGYGAHRMALHLP